MVRERLPSSGSAQPHDLPAGPLRLGPRSMVWQADPGLTTSELRVLPGQSSAGTVPEWVVGMTLGGQVEYTTVEGAFVARAGDVMLTPPQAHVRWRVPQVDARRIARSKDAGVWHIIYCIFRPRPHWRGWLDFPGRATGFLKPLVTDPKVLREIRLGLFEAHRFAGSALADRTEFAMNAIERVLLWCRAEQLRRDSALDPRVARAVDYLTEHATQAVTLADVSHACHASRSQLAFLFTRQVGVPPMTFHEQQRLQRAAQMLRQTHDPIKVIADSVGFDDPRYFAKRFKRHAGVTPRQYRKKPPGSA